MSVSLSGLRADVDGCVLARSFPSPSPSPSPAGVLLEQCHDHGFFRAAGEKQIEGGVGCRVGSQQGSTRGLRSC